MITFSKTVRTTTRQTQRPLPTRQTQQTSLTGRRNVPDLDTTRQTQRALPKNRSTILTYYKTVRTHRANQLHKLDRPAKHLDDSTKSTDGFHRTL